MVKDSRSSAHPSHADSIVATLVLSLTLPVFAAPPAAPAPQKPAAPKLAAPAPPAKTPAPPKTSPAPGPPPAAQRGKPVLEDKILAVVDEDPILASDVTRAVKLGLAQPSSGEAPAAFQKRLLSQLIDERVRFHEVDRFGFTEVPVDDIEAQVKKIHAGFPDERAFQKALAEVGLNLQGLRQLVTRQLLVVTYVEERLGPRVFISSDDINKYYRTVLTPEMQKRGQPLPPPDDVRDSIRDLLHQQKLNEEMAKWTDELRTKANVVVHPPPGSEKPLPPVVKKVTAAKTPP
jgi:hypothetical protein